MESNGKVVLEECDANTKMQDSLKRVNSCMVDMDTFHTLCSFIEPSDSEWCRLWGINVANTKMTSPQEERRTKFLNKMKSNAIIKGANGNYYDKHQMDYKNITFAEVYSSLQKCCVTGGGTIFDYVEEDSHQHETDIITFGPNFTFPHKDFLFQGSDCTFVDWLPGAVKLFFFAANNTRYANQSMMCKQPCSKVNLVLHIKELIGKCSRGEVKVVAVCSGQNLCLPAGLTHVS
jgi:hypothetical protein